MFSSLRSLGISSLLIDHTNKQNGELFGSVYKFNSSRQVFEIKKSQIEGQDKLVLGLFHKKANNSRLIKPMGIELLFNEEMQSMSVIRKDVKDTPLEDQLGVRQRIGNVLSAFGKMTVSEIVDELNPKPDGSLFTENHISKELSTGKRKNIFVQLPDNKWGLSANNFQSVDYEAVKQQYNEELRGEV